jgi:AAA domain
MLETAGSSIAAVYVYVDTAFGSLNRRNHVQRIGEVNFADQGAERYISHRRGSAALLDWVNSHHNASGNPTIEGFDGEVWDTSLPFDFDDRSDPAQALEWVRQFLQRLELEDVPLDALRFYFSGAKGFHVEIPHTLFGGFVPDTELHVYERRAALELMGSIPFDKSIYDKLRLWRLPNTLNAKGNRYKIQLSLTEILGADMPNISSMAERPRPRLAHAPTDDWGPNAYLVEVWTRAHADEQAAVYEPVQQPWSDARGNLVFSAAAAAAIAASWPAGAGVSRHTDYLLPLSGYLSRQLGPEPAADLLKQAARMAGDTSFLEDRSRHWEAEVERLCEGSATKIVNSQPVEGLPTISKRWPELAEFLSTHFVVRANTDNTTKKDRSTGFSFSALELALAEPPEITPFLVDAMLPRGGVSIFGAKPKVGKSVMVRNLAMSVARGEPFLGRACQQGTVLVLALEEKRAEVINHFRAMGGVDEAIHLHVGPAPSTSREGLGALALSIRQYQPALVIVDPIFKLVRVKDSSDYAELTRELEPVLELARTSDCHIALTHHLGKLVREGGDDLLGSTAIFGAVDTLALMRRLRDDQRTLGTIQRYGADLVETAVPMDEEGVVSLGALVSEIKLKEARRRVLEVLSRFAEDYWPTTDKIRESAELDRNQCVRALKELVEEGVVMIRGAGKTRDPFQYHRAASGSSEPETEPDKAEVSVFPYLLRDTAIQQLGICKACGRGLSETEVRAGFGLHLTCSLPLEAPAL